MSNVWRGSNYDETRLLLLGESAHTWEEDGKIYHPSPTHAIGLVEDIIEKMPANEAKNRFMAMLSRGLCGEKRPNRQQLEAAWSRVAFTNYVKEELNAARERPTFEMWENASANFPSLLEELRPRNVIVLGKEMWRNMPNAPLWLTDDVQGYKLSGDEFSICWAVSHPTAYDGLSWTRLASLIEFITAHKARVWINE